MRKNTKDISGQKFNMLTAIKYQWSNNGAYWLFKCDCGNEKTERSSLVTMGHIKSCGCLAKRTMFKQKTLLSPGDKINNVSLIKIKGKKGHNILWECKCYCGTLFNSLASNLASGNTKSCGCRRAATMKKIATTHGLSKTKSYKIWRGMIARCVDKNNQAYINYGGRGIKVSKRWQKFENFFSDMGEKPENKSLDRINNNGNYEPKNCRWATRKEQNNNYRKNVNIEINGVIKNVTQWAEYAGISAKTIWSRINLGWQGEVLLRKDKYKRK